MHRAAAVVLAPVALVAYLLLWPQAPVVEGDSPQYLEVARDLTDGRLDALHDRTPGYPALLVLTGAARKPNRTLLVVSLGLHLASVWMLAAALQATGVRPSWILFFVAVLLLPPHVEPAAHGMTENLAQFTLVAGYCALLAGVTRVRLWLVAAAGVAFAASCLTRPIYQAITLALAGCVLAIVALKRPAGVSMRRAMAACSLIVAVPILILGPYAYRNWTRFGFFGVTHTVGFHLSTKTMGVVERLPDEHRVVREILVRERDAQLTARGGTHNPTQAIWSARPELAAATGLAPPELSRYLLTLNLYLIGIAPIEYLQEVARSLSTYWFPAAGPLASLNSSVLRWTWAIVHALVLVAFAAHLTVLLGMWLFDVSRRGITRDFRQIRCSVAVTDVQAFAYGLAGTIVFYNMVLSCFLDIGETRQRRPTEMFIVLMCVLGLHIWGASAREPRR